MPRVYLTDLQRAKGKKFSFLEFVEGRRKTKRIKQEDLAKALMISQQSISTRLQGTTDLTFVDFVMFAKMLDMTDEEIIKAVRI